MSEYSPANEIPSELVFERLKAFELGDGLMFSDLNRGHFVYNTNTENWIQWAGHHWELDTQNNAKSAVEKVAERYMQEALLLVRKIDEATKSGNIEAQHSLERLQKSIYDRVRKLRSSRGRINCLEFAHTNPYAPLSIKGDVIDQQPWLFPCANGVWNLRTGEFEEGRHDDWLIKSSPHDAEGIDAPCPNWQAFLNSIFEDDGIDEATGRPNGTLLVEYVQRLLGYAMTGLSVEHVLPILWGQGRNGKGTLVETINFVAGPLSGPIQSEMLLSQRGPKNAAAPSPEIMDLQGRRFAWASETDEGQFFSPSKIKWFSGGDTLTGRAPHATYITTFRPTHTLFLLTNNVPHAPSDDFAFWERIHLIPFKWSFVARPPAAPNERQADKDLPEKLKQEAAGILAWLVRGCLAWQEQGLNAPAIVKKATEDYRRDEDVLADWIDECCFVDPSAESSAKMLFDSFTTWWEDNVSKKTPSQKKFGRMMSKRFRREKHGTIMYFGIRPLLGSEAKQ